MKTTPTGRTRSRGPRLCADRSGAETDPATSGETVRRTTKIVLRSDKIAGMGFEPMFAAYEAAVEPLQLNPQAVIRT